MADFPLSPANRPFGTLSTCDPTGGGIGEYLLCTNSAATSSATWPSANLAIYTPVLVEKTCTAYQMGIQVATQSGNVDVAIYTETGTRLVSAGSTATAAAGAQVFNVTDTVLSPGVYFVAMACDNTTAAFFRAAPPVAAVGRMNGLQQQASAFALPSSATFATYAQGYVPLVAVSTVATI